VASTIWPPRRDRSRTWNSTSSSDRLCSTSIRNMTIDLLPLGGLTRLLCRSPKMMAAFLCCDAQYIIREILRETQHVAGWGVLLLLHRAPRKGTGKHRLRCNHRARCRSLGAASAVNTHIRLVRAADADAMPVHLAQAVAGRRIFGTSGCRVDEFTHGGPSRTCGDAGTQSDGGIGTPPLRQGISSAERSACN
jgi:hypothetical protein